MMGAAHAAADAQRDQRATRVAALELVDHGAGDHRAGSAQRVADRDGAAVDVELLVGTSRSFWNFSTTDANSSFSSNRSMSSTVRPAREHLARGGGRAGEHDDRLRAAGGGGDDVRPRAQALRLACGFGTDEHQRGAVDDAGAVAAGVDVVDLFDEVVLLQQRRRAAHLADAVERGLQLAQAVQRGVGAHVLVVVEDDQTVLIGTGTTDFAQ